MPQKICCLLFAVLVPLALAQVKPASPELASILNFEAEHTGGRPQGWITFGDVFLDSEVVHSGRRAVRVERTEGSEGRNSGMDITVAAGIEGKTLELRGFVRTQNVSTHAGLWLRLDGDVMGLAYATSERNALKGTNGWAQYSLRVGLHPDNRFVAAGFVLIGSGKAWVDDLELLVDGKPIWEAPKLPPTIIDLDHEFDGGSRIAITGLDPARIANLVVLGKVWGFLKYHHPLVTAGKFHWDYELFRILPKVLSAGGRTDANAAIAKWVVGLGEVAPCAECAALDERQIHLRPPLDWLEDEWLLGAELSGALRHIHRNRPAGGRQFFVSLVRGVGNASFDHEPAYGKLKTPDAGFRLLALYRFWNMVEYWSPYRDVIGEKWDDVLARFIPRIALAKDSNEYQLELLALIARLNDGHSSNSSMNAARPPVGKCSVPVPVRFLGSEAVVGRGAPEGAGLKPGDVILSIDGTPVRELVARWTPYYAASNQAGLLRNVGSTLMRGECGRVTLRVRRETGTEDVTVTRVPAGNTPPQSSARDLPGETFRLLSKDVAYLKLSSVKIADVAQYVRSGKDTKGWIIDIRNYPAEFVTHPLGSLLVDRKVETVAFTIGDLTNPGAFHARERASLEPKEPHYAGKVVILVDEVTLSQAEYTAMTFR